MNKDYISFLENYDYSQSDYIDYFKRAYEGNSMNQNFSIDNFDSYPNLYSKKHAESIILEKSSPLLSLLTPTFFSFGDSVLANKFQEKDIDSTENDYSKNDKLINNSSKITASGNQEILKQLNNQNERFEKRILDIIKSEMYESGKVSKIEKFMFDDCNDNNLVFIKQVALKILYDNINNSHIVEGILRLLSTKSYDEMTPEGPMCCLSLLSNKSLLIRNKAIEIFEKWNSKKCIKQLETQHCSPAWVQKHLLNVIEYLKKYGN